MMKNKAYVFIFYGFVAVIMYSCSGTEHLRGDQVLYTGANVKIESKDKIPDRKQLIANLEDGLRPKPNSKILGMRPGVWIYTLTSDTAKKASKFRKWVQAKLGEKPVLLEDVNVKTNENILKNRLQNLGYFQAEIKNDMKMKHRKAHMTYTVAIQRPYIINKLFYPAGDSTRVNKYFKKMKETSAIREGQQYNLQALIDERARIDNYLKQQGFFYFKPVYLEWKVDSTIGDRKINVYLNLKSDLPPQATRYYKIKDVFVDPGYSLSVIGDSIKNADTVVFYKYKYINKNNDFRPRALIRAVFIRPGRLYNYEDYQLTLSRLMNLGVFKYANIQFEELASIDTGLLNAYVNLTPLPRKSIRAELRLVSKSNNNAGPDLQLSFKNRNVFKGAEQLQLNFTSSFQTLISEKEKGLNSFQAGVNSELDIPRFIIPWHLKFHKTTTLPLTRFKLGYEYFRRVGYYTNNTFNFLYGYRWNETVDKQHEINPINISFLQLSNVTPAFKELLDKNYFLQKSFKQQFVPAGSYSFTYNSVLKAPAKNDFYFNGNVEEAGNLIYFIQRINRAAPNPDTPFTIFGKPYSQYSRFDIDAHYFHNLKNENRLGARLVAGVGIPYGNANALPYTRQFFAGGNNSVRAFQPRGLGPGAYQPTDAEKRTSFFDQSGDIKLEATGEFRFPIYKYIKGAVFTDAGNVWLIRAHNAEDSALKVFRTDKFINQIAVGGGFGIRVDVSFFVLRFDLATPLRKPWETDGSHWVISKMTPGSGAWRRDNLILNIAIGYPF